MILQYTLAIARQQLDLSLLYALKFAYYAFGIAPILCLDLCCSTVNYASNNTQFDVIIILVIPNIT